MIFDLAFHYSFSPYIWTGWLKASCGTKQWFRGEKLFVVFLVYVQPARSDFWYFIPWSSKFSFLMHLRFQENRCSVESTRISIKPFKVLSQFWVFVDDIETSNMVLLYLISKPIVKRSCMTIRIDWKDKLIELRFWTRTVLFFAIKHIEKLITKK